MDYKRIYLEFIADRRERSSIGYTEKHHVVPRSMGGSDEPANIIALTPEDHFFAHLLLAKAYGGSQWGGVFAMASMINQATEPRKVFAARYMVGVARRRFSQHISAIHSGSRREKLDRVATLYHDDGRSVQGSRSQLAEATGLSIASVSRLCTGKQGRSYNGWFANTAAAKHSLEAKRQTGRASHAQVAGVNRRQVRRLSCGTVYPSLTAAGQECGTNTSNIARAIRVGGKTAGSAWAYAG